MPPIASRSPHKFGRRRKSSDVEVRSLADGRVWKPCGHSPQCPLHSGQPSQGGPTPGVSLRCPGRTSAPSISNQRTATIGCCSQGKPVRRRLREAIAFLLLFLEASEIDFGIAGLKTMLRIMTRFKHLASRGRVGKLLIPNRMKCIEMSSHENTQILCEQES